MAKWESFDLYIPAWTEVLCQEDVTTSNMAGSIIFADNDVNDVCTLC